MQMGRGVVWITGLALITAGLIILYLSYSSTTGWWQGTEQAMGVGLFVGGLVDVLTVSSVDALMRATDERRRKAAYAQEQREKDNARNKARMILGAMRSDIPFESKVDEIAYYLEINWDNPGVRDALLSELDPQLRQAALYKASRRLASLRHDSDFGARPNYPGYTGITGMYGSEW
jgi:hypothetical protein